MHESEFQTDDAISMTLTGKGLFSDSSPSYSLTLYPSKEFNNVYATKNPIIATVGSLVAILITSICFFGYDCMVNRDLRIKKQMFVAGWNHRKRYEEERRRAEGGDKDEEAEDEDADTAAVSSLLPKVHEASDVRSNDSQCSANASDSSMISAEESSSP